MKGDKGRGGSGAKPLMKMVGPTGFEPATSASQTQRSSQAELRSVVRRGVLQPLARRPVPEICQAGQAEMRGVRGWNGGVVKALGVVS
jgi:hypothetical protein